MGEPAERSFVATLVESGSVGSATIARQPAPKLSRPGARLQVSGESSQDVGEGAHWVPQEPGIKFQLSLLLLNADDVYYRPHLNPSKVLWLQPEFDFLLLRPYCQMTGG